MDDDSRDPRDAGTGGGNRGDRGGGRRRGGDGWRDHRGGRGGEAQQQSVILDGGHLLSLLKANPPSSKKYTREELLSIKQLSTSNVKPAKLSPMIDRENVTSPLVLKGKFDLEEDGNGIGRREHHRERRAQRTDRDEAEDSDQRRRAQRKGYDGMSGGNMAMGGSMASQAAAAPPAAAATNGGYDRNGPRARDMQAASQWGFTEHAVAPDAGRYHQQRPHRQPKTEVAPEWDMPDPHAKPTTMSLSDFTLGDIRQADAGGLGGGGDSFFVDEEDEDATRASRGFGKWFGRRVAPTSADREPPLNLNGALPAAVPPLTTNSVAAVASQQPGVSAPAASASSYSSAATVPAVSTVFAASASQVAAATPAQPTAAWPQSEPSHQSLHAQAHSSLAPQLQAQLQPQPQLQARQPQQPPQLQEQQPPQPPPLLQAPAPCPTGTAAQSMAAQQAQAEDAWRLQCQWSSSDDRVCAGAAQAADEDSGCSQA